jgi:hypothetical protein
MFTETDPFHSGFYYFLSFYSIPFLPFYSNLYSLCIQGELLLWFWEVSGLHGVLARKPAI